MEKTIYKKPAFFSIILHTLLLSCFIFSFQFFEKKNYVSDTAVMTATLVEIPKPTVKEVNKTKEIVLQKQEKVSPIPPPVIPKPKPIVVTKPQPVKPLIEKAVKIEEKKSTPEKPKPVVKQEVKTEKTTIKKEETKPVEEKKAVRVKVDEAQKKMEEKLWAEQLAEEDKHLTVQKAQQAKGELNKYNALILQAIREQWLLPEAYDAGISCQLLISLKSDGSVTDVKLTKSSGSEVFDRSARTAVYKASPLPVPKEADVFNQMKEINLTVRP